MIDNVKGAKVVQSVCHLLGQIFDPLFIYALIIEHRLYVYTHTIPESGHRVTPRPGRHRWSSVSRLSRALIGSGEQHLKTND
uniref:Uncharacterized protein n=1 Tax=Romanomermis culicivorax TaxID=13658 RepID=A0A915L212_ROMCU